MSEANVPPVCSRCNTYIYDGTIVQMEEKYLHTNCVQCVICRKSITGSCHLKDNDYYCRLDFIRLHGTKCSSCHEIISPSEGVHDVNGRLYHTTCFSCSTCTRELCTGDFVYLKEDGKLLCSHDYQLVTASGNAQPETDSGSDESGSDDTDVRHQMTVNDTQQCVLNDAYNQNKRPSKKTRTQLGKDTSLNDRTIQMWFHNRRAKDKSNLSQSNVLVSKRRHTVDHRAVNKHDERHWADNKPEGHRSSFGANQSFPNEAATFNSNTLSSNFQLFCPLDYLVPNEMPPNVDLSSADICNGEVIPGKHNTTTNYHTRHVPEYINQWLTI